MSNKKINPKQRDFFEEMACKWDEVTHHDPEKLEYMTDTLGLFPGCSVLDVGTGTGVMVPGYAGRGAGRILGLDYSENMIGECRKKFGAEYEGILELEVADLYEFRTGERFDFVVCYSCFPHFVDQPAAVRILSSLLKPEGRLLIAHSSGRDDINKVHMEAGELVSNDFLPPSSETVAMMEDAGLECVSVRDDDEYYMVMGVRK